MVPVLGIDFRFHGLPRHAGPATGRRVSGRLPSRGYGGHSRLRPCRHPQHDLERSALDGDAQIRVRRGGLRSSHRRDVRVALARIGLTRFRVSRGQALPSNRIECPSTGNKLRAAWIPLVMFTGALVSVRLIPRLDAYREWSAELPTVLRWLQQPLWWLLLCMAGLFVARGVTLLGALAELGLRASLVRGVGFGFVATLPMLVGGVLWGRFGVDESALSIVFGSAVWPLGEEILFRGYAFRQLHRTAGWNLWLAAATTGLIFGAVHLGNASVQRLPWQSQLGTVAVIGIGGLLFAWIFARLNDNLWAVWSLHGFMNLWWSVFDLSDNPLGGWIPNLLRVLTVTLAIVLTIRFARSRRNKGQGESAPSVAYTG
ncbi:MAG: CPBP family intramembrane metalloprotease [Planctomycetota bacterium]|nr:MAG: CPBP family intramembrane metalloprotease [Planctomycetota bacterium]